LGAAVGHDRSLPAILNDVRCSEKLAGRLGGIFGERGDTLNLEAIDPARTVEFLEVLAETIEVKDPYMRGHARRVAYYSSLIAYRMHLSAEEHDHVRLAAFLHDLGKVGVPTDLLLRPSALSREERAIVQEHPAIGARLIRPLNIAAPVSEAIRHHHEWWDGTGYPDGLAGTDVPLVARVIGVADAFDAMSSDRPYRKALSRETAVSELRRYAGIQFDPDVVVEFLAILELGVCDSNPEFLTGIISESDTASAAVALS
jgi:HD-GYP domain-containing protein (c-di-GMP phosphodiesterase class II)